SSTMSTSVTNDYHASVSRGQKRRLLDNLLAEKMSGIESPSIKRRSVLEQYRQELNEIMLGKEDFIRTQRHSSLVIEPRRIDDDGVMARFAPLYQQVSQLHTDPEDHADHLNLIKDIIKGSIILEWPRAVYGVHKSGHDEPTEVDQAPLIHRARNVVKCRTSHPTMRIKVYALSAAAEQQRGSGNGGPQLVEALFRCSLTKAQSGVVGEHCDSRNATIAGRMILTQREGTAAPKTTAFTGAVVNGEGKLVASQAAPDTHTFDLLTIYSENMRSTSFKYENGVLCATFPEMGVTLNSMVDRRQLATRYAILNEVFIKIDTLVIEHAFQSLPFLIAITNDQTEPLLNSIIWSRMLDKEHYDGSEPQCQITYGVLKEASRQFVKSQISQARALTDRELLHFQAMHFLPKVNKCRNEFEVDNLENCLYLAPDEIFSKFDTRAVDTTIADIDKMREGKRRLKDRLLSEFVKDHVIIEKHDFMAETCVSILDGRSELRHTPWQWLFKATELILDVGHKLCPSPAIAEKKSTKTKKQLAAAEEYHTMMSLFNKGVVSFFSVYDTHTAFKQLKEDGEDLNDGGNIMLRFCDENAGHLSFVFGLDEKDKLTMGSIAGETIKDFKQGLSEALMDEEFPAQHGRLVRMNVHPDRQTEKWCSTIRKRSLFNTYQSLRQIETKTPFPDEEITTRINPFSGTLINRDKFKHPLFPTPFESALSALSTSPFNSPMIGSMPPQPTTGAKKRGRKPTSAQPLSTPMVEPAIFFNESLFSTLNSSVSSPATLGDGLLNGDHDTSKSNSPAARSSSSPKVTAASPFASLSGARAAAAAAPTAMIAATAAAAAPSSSNGSSAQSAESVAAIMEQPLFQTMLSQIMQQTISQMFSGGDLSRIGTEEPEDQKPNRAKLKLETTAAVPAPPQSLDDILRATEGNETSDNETEY
ncbi:hypothetical protein PENTCL1PPCAC_9357, partial [Pristionchus entomophagus]